MADALHPPPARSQDGQRPKDVRQWRITEHLVHHGDSSPQELAREFNVSLMTIHRDLDALERRGVVRKFHGGVTVQPSGVFESQLSFRLRANPLEKRAIAEAALRYVHPGMSIMLDDSTSALQMVPGLKERGPLHVATNFVQAISRLAEIADEGNLTIMGMGGLYDQPHDALVGLQCVEQISNIRADALFMSTSAVSGCEGFHQEERIVAIKRAMMQASTTRYLLIDHLKLGRVALHRVAPLKDFDLVITDEGADPEVLREWENAGITYEIAPSI